jgi:hypothetical protein
MQSAVGTLCFEKDRLSHTFQSSLYNGIKGSKSSVVGQQTWSWR